MPTYEYRCTDCGRDLEVVQKFSDASLTVCPTCSGKLRKVFNAVGVVFKGSGFYRNDSRASSGGGASADGVGSEKKTDSTEKATESKPATVDAAKKETKTESSKPVKVAANGSSSSSSTGSKTATT